MGRNAGDPSSRFLPKIGSFLFVGRYKNRNGEEEGGGSPVVKLVTDPRRVTGKQKGEGEKLGNPKDASNGVRAQV